MSGDVVASRLPARTVPAGALAAAAAMPVAMRALSYTDRILDRDEAYWMASALRMRDLDVPLYVAGWDTKPPLPFLLHRAGLALLPDAPMLGSHLVAALLAAAAAAVLAGAVTRLAGVRAGLVAALAFALLDASGPVRALAANSELCSYVPVALLLLAVSGATPGSPRTAFAAGACAALAAFAKLPGALYVPAAWIAVLAAAGAARRPLASLAAGAAGTAAVVGGAFLWLGATGAWDDFWACNVGISLHRAQHGIEISTTVSYDRWIAVAAANAPALAAAVLGAGAARDRRGIRIVAPLAAAGLVSAWASGAAFQHYLQLAYVPVAALAGLGVAALADRAAARLAPARSAALAAAAMLLAAGPDRLGQWRSRDWAGYDGGAMPAVCERIREIVPAGGTMFVWGIHPDLYVLAGRAPASRFVSAGWLVGSYSGRPLAPEPFEFVPGSWDLLFRDLEETRPVLVVDSVPSGAHGFGSFPVSRFPRLEAWLAAGYEREEAPGGYVFWRRRRA